MMLDIILRNELPGLNEITNINRRNRYAGARQKDTTTDALALAIRVTRCRPLENIPHIWAFIWTCENKRRDPDNIAAGQKFIFDALQVAGIIVNDGWGQVAEIHHYFEVGDTPSVRVKAYAR